MSDSLNQRLLLRDEGIRLEPYKDHLGFWTVGVGHVIDRRKGGSLPVWVKPSFPLDEAEAKQLLRADIRQKEIGLDGALPWWRGLSDVRKAVLVSMAFQMGVGGVLQFKNTLKAVQEGRWADAAKGMRDSRWHSQTTERAERLAKAMESDDESALELA